MAIMKKKKTRKALNFKPTIDDILIHPATSHEKQAVSGHKI